MGYDLAIGAGGNPILLCVQDHIGNKSTDFLVLS